MSTRKTKVSRLIDTLDRWATAVIWVGLFCVTGWVVGILSIVK